MTPDDYLNARIVRGDSRNMMELGDETVDLAVTSPPYWQIKDYGAPGQIGYGQSLHEYLSAISRVWSECARVLRPGRRLCINIGDQFARALIYGRYKIIPLHAEVIAQCEAIGLDYLGAIIWQKKTTMNTTGGAVVMGSFPHPPNGIVELDYEYILLFKKPGPSPRVSPERKEASKLSTEEWKQFFSGHWHFGGARQTALHEAVFPDELPRRLIRMFSFVGDTVLDPFLGSGTTAKVALELGRSTVGYEVQPKFLPLIQEKLCSYDACITLSEPANVRLPVAVPADYRPHVRDAQALLPPERHRSDQNARHKIAEIMDATTLRLDTGQAIHLLGISVPAEYNVQAINYLRSYVLGKKVLVKAESVMDEGHTGSTPIYLYLANKIFINRKMIEMGIALVDRAIQHRFYGRFIAAEVKTTGSR